MADAVIQLSVQFKDAVQNFKSLVETYQKELDKLTPGTSIYKSIEAQLKQAMTLVKRTDLQANIGVSKDSQITKMVTDLEGVQRILGNVKETFSNLGFKDINLGHSSFEQFKNDVRTIENEIKSLNAKKQELENLTVAGALNKAKLDKKGFSQKDLDKGVIEYYEEVTAAVQKAESAIAKLQEQQKLLNTSMTANQSTMDSTKNAHFLSNLYNSFGKTSSNFSKDALITNYSNMLTEQHKAGTLNSQEVQNALKMIGLDDATINAIIAAGKDASQRLQQALANISANKLKIDIKDYLNKTYGTGGKGGISGMQEQAKAYDAANKSLTTENARLAQITKDLTTQTKSLNRYKGRQDKLSGVAKDYSTLQNNLNTLSQRITALEQQVSNSVGKGLGTGNVPAGDPQASGGLAKQEAQQQMGSAIDNMARRWVGTYAIVNKVRQAVRQAWNDIKGLDKAMTDIAVVTEMSVDELWGKIDQYMDIAQQYGVTTQGVYEVSQIYYQQGLSTAEVMAATTETLKMARIAGMDYKEAADAMTVAIRAFKMEMSDAQHVTDVYSKVAAVTASDTNELATAMSKTASSAESVGSSFENTTAMLAVMIETTRESAQNLGSALKSIISRYGEMKVGLTVDSEGEEIDYNKVDTALKSVGISIKDAQGQFRNFDEVIFELSEKWDSLDKNTQRYIATIMAGNRQQSRFIALVDNWERLDEVATAAQDSEDAGLLQYSKTLDSLDAKINNLKNSFQELYMGIANGAVFKGLLTTLNEIITGFSNMGSGLLVALPGMIAGIRALFAFIKMGASNAFSGMYAQAKTSADLVANYQIGKHKQTQATKTTDTAAGVNQRKAIEQQSENQISSHAIKTYRLTQASKTTINKMEANKRASQENLAAEQVAAVRGTKRYQELINQGYGRRTAYQKALNSQRKSQNRKQYLKEGWKSSKAWAFGSMALSMAGMGLSTWGAQQSGAGNHVAGAALGMGGNALSGASMGAAAGPWGAAIGGIIGALSGLPTLLNELNVNTKLQRKYEESKKQAEESNLKRAEAKEEYSSLKTLIEKVQSTEEFKNDSKESYQEWVDANNALVEKYPEMLGYIDEYGNSIANLTDSSEILASKMLLAAESASEYYEEKEEEIRDRIDEYSQHQKTITFTSSSQQSSLGVSVNMGTMEGEFYNYLKDNGLLGSKFSQSGTDSYSGTIHSSTSQSAWITPEIIKSYADTKGIDLQKLFSNLTVHENGGIFLRQGAFTDQEQSLYSNLLQELKSSQYISSKDGKIQIDEKLQNYLSSAKDWQELQAIKRSSLNQSLSTASYLTAFDDSVQSVEGFTSLLTIYAQEIQKVVSNEDLYDIYKKPDEYKKLVEEFVNFYELLDLKKQEIFNSLYEDLNNFTLEELEEQLKYIEAPDNITNTYKLQWYQKNYSTKSRLVKAIDESFFSEYSGEGVTLNGVSYSQDAIKELGSYSEWLQYSNKEGTLQDQQEYYDLVAEVIGTSNNELRDFILRSTTETGDAYIKILRSQTKIIDSGGIAGDAAEDRLSKVQEILQEIYSEDFLTKHGLPEDFNIEEYTKLLLADNIGSQEWANALEDFEKKYNLNLANFNEQVFENFGTYLAQTTENMNSAIEDFKNISEVQSKGIDDFEKALKYYKDYAGDLAWDDFYTWTEDGKLIFKNIDQVFSQIGNDVIEVSKQYSQALEAITLNGTKNLDPLRLYKGDFYTSDQLISNLNTKEKPTLESLYSDMDRIGIFSEDIYNEVAAWWDWTGEWDEQDIKELEAILAKSDLKTLYNHYKEGLVEIKDLTGSLESFGFTEEQLHDIQTWLATDGKDASYDELLAYLQEQSDLLNAQSEYYIQQRKALAKQARQLTFSTAVEGDIKEYNDKQLVGQIIQSGNEFTIEQLQAIGNNLDATYDEVAEIFSLQRDPSKNVWTQKEGLDLDASKTLISNKVAEATEAYEDAKKADSGKTEDEIAALEQEKERWELIQTYFDGTDDIYTRLFDSSSKWEEVNNSIEAYNKEQIFSDGKIDLNELKVLSENEEVLTNLLDKGILTWNDALQSFELTQQTLTDEQKAILETAGIDPNTWVNLVSKQVKSWQEQAEEIISSGGKNLTAQDIETLKNAGYNLEISEGESLSLSQYKTLADANDAAAAVYLEQQSKEVSDKLLEIVLKPAETALEDLINLGETIGGEGSVNTEGYIAAINAAEEGNFDAIYGIVEELLQAADGILDISTDSINAQKTINKNEVSSSIQDSLSSAYSDLTNVSLSSLTELWKTVYGKTEIDSSTVNSYEDALNAAEQGETEALINILQQLTQTAIQQGYDIDTSAFEAAYKDAANSLIQSLISMLSSAVEGTLSATDMLTLAEKTGLNIEQYATRTVDGWKLSTEGLLAVGAKLEEQYGNVEGVTESIMESLVGEGKSYKGLEDIQEAIANIEAKINSIKDSNSELTKEYNAQLKLLREMENTQFLDPNDPRFNFMDKDSTRGFANGTEEMAATIQDALQALSTLRSGEAIDADSFYNMFDQMYKFRDKNLTDMDWLTSLGFTSEALNELSNAEGKVITSYEDFVTAMISQHGALNEIDGDVLLEMGLNVEAAAGATQKGLREVADQQIDFLKGIKAVLEAMGALEGLGEFNLELGITSPDGTPITLQNFTEFLDVPGIEKYVQDAVIRLQTQLSDLNFGEDFINNLFGSDGFKFTDAKDLEALQGMGNFIALFKKDSAEMWENFATQYPNIVKKDGQIDWAELANVVASMDNLEAFSNGVSAKVEAAVNSSLIAQGFNIKLEGSKITLGEGVDDQTKEQIKQAIIDEYAKYNTAVEVDFVGNEAVIHVIDPSVSVAMDTLNEKGINWSDYNFEGKFFESEKITFTYEQSEVEFRLRIDKFGKVTAVDANDKEIDSKIVQQYLDDNKISYEATGEEGATFGVQLITPPESEDTVAAIAADVQTIVDLLGAGIKITVEDENTQTVIDAILASYKLLEQYLLEHPLSFDASNVASIAGTVAQGSQESGNSNNTDLNILKQTIELEWKNLEGYKQEDLEQSIDVNYNGLKTYLPTITQKVNLDYSENSTPGIGESGTTGATGNVNLMKYGAALAKGTLMGELGPELYVQGGQYRIAGANGPEFVDLQSDAIVFNHLQTAKLLNNGHVSSHGSPVISEHHAVKAYATGNVNGIALAGGREDAIAAIDRAIAIWQGIKNASLADMLGSGGGGGSGNSIQAVTAELIEWYNLTRKIAKVEADINQLTAERENIHKRDGAAYLRNLREETKLLQEQYSYNATLRDYKKAQLDRQAREINENQYWSQFMHVDENGLLQYNFGNEANGGKGTLKDLQDFVEMSGEEQQAFLKEIGYSYTTADGEVLEGTELAEMFLEEAQAQIDNYDALYDSWRELGIELENLEQQVAEIEEEIKNNQIELEQDIYDIIVEAWEKEIEAMEEHAELVKEAGEEYVSGLRDAINAEKDMYDRNQATADREQLQRQLALLRRSGGSASEIANLENQLDDMFKDEYFNNQEQMVEDIAKANEEQNKKLEEQIRIQQESLEYQKEHGLIWQQVYDVMSGTTEEILAFMQGRSTEFFTQSLLGQEEMLTEWAHKIGIYTEERAIQSAGSAGLAKYWDNGSVWSNSAMAGLQNFYNSMSQEDQDFVRKQFATAYGTAINNGSTETEAYQAAIEAVSGHLEDRQSASMAQEQEASHTTQGTAADYRYVQGGNLHLRANASTSSTSYGTYGTGTKVKVLSDEGEWCKVEVNGKTGYMMSKYLAKSGSGSGSSGTGSDSGTTTTYRQQATAKGADGKNYYGKGVSTNSQWEAQQIALRYLKQNIAKAGTTMVGTPTYSAYAQGGLVDYTGLAVVHGKPSKPEAFLNASQTKLISDSLKIAGDGGALDHLRSAIEGIRTLAKGFQTTNYNNPSVSIAPGAITIQIAELASSYDIEDISRDIIDRINTIAAKATSRSVNRR